MEYTPVTALLSPYRDSTFNSCDKNLMGLIPIVTLLMKTMDQ